MEEGVVRKSDIKDTMRRRGVGGGGGGVEMGTGKKDTLHVDEVEKSDEN